MYDLINQFVDWQHKSPTEEEKGLEAKHLFVPGAFLVIGHRS
jgi:hypothetical protein